MILITGSTGNIGAPLLKRLIDRGASLRALVRDPAKESAQVAAMQVRGVQVVAGDLANAASLDSAVAGIDAAFLLTPVSRDTVAWKSNLIKAASKAGVKRVVNLSVAGAGPASPIVLGKWHAEAEKELEASGMAWTHLRPYDLARYNTNMFLMTARTQGAFYFTVGDGRVAMVDEEDVAAVTTEALLNPKHAGQTYTLTGPEALSYPQIATAISEQIGRPTRYVNITEAEARTAMLGMGLPDWLGDFINDLRRMERDGGGAAVTNDIEQVTGRPATPYAATLRAALGATPPAA